MPPGRCCGRDELDSSGGAMPALATLVKFLYTGMLVRRVDDDHNILEIYQRYGTMWLSNVCSHYTRRSKGQGLCLKSRSMSPNAQSETLSMLKRNKELDPCFSPLNPASGSKFCRPKIL